MVHLIMWHFMELKKAQGSWRSAGFLWLASVTAISLAGYVFPLTTSLPRLLRDERRCALLPISLNLWRGWAE